MSEQIETWKQILNYVNYQVSSFGNVRNITTNKICKQSLTGREWNKGKGYLRVAICKEGVFKSRCVHQLMAETFLEHKPDGTNKFVVDHIDGDRLNNNLSNLKVITNRENLSKYKNKSSKYTGVHYHVSNKAWMANIWHNDKKVYLGSFKTEIEAHFKYQEYLNKEILCHTK